jgi:hypothetical protein
LELCCDDDDDDDDDEDDDDDDDVKVRTNAKAKLYMMFIAIVKSIVCVPRSRDTIDI